MDEKLVKEACKEALKEWLDEKYANIGRWSLGIFAVLAVSGLGYVILFFNGWTK